MGKSAKKLKFEEAMRRLDEIVTAMESGEIGIEESLARYEEAMVLAAQCRRIIDEAEQRIKRIQLEADGTLRETPLSGPAEDEAEEDGEPER